jgi:uncharacterized protein (DUF1015 family)
MATVKPFAALRPKAELAERICELPYDVMSSDEARQIASGNPLSFLRVSKPEIDLPPATDLRAPEVYAKGKENFERLIAQGALRQDSAPCFYLYRQVMGKHSQTGLVAVASCDEYLRGVIKKHELTRPGKEDDRVRHIETLNAQTGPAFLTYRAVPALDEFVAKRTQAEPDVDFTAKDGVCHTSWAISDFAGIKFIEANFARIPCLYIADGHHRSAAAARVYLKRKEASSHPPAWPGPLRRGEGPASVRSSAFTRPKPPDPLRRSDSAARGGTPNAGAAASFLAVIFPHNQMQILPYNRVLKDLNGLTPEQLLEKLSSLFVIQPSGRPAPACEHELGFYLQGRWLTLSFRPRFSAADSPIDKLDVTLLQKHVLAPIFGIADPQTSERIDFVGGLRGTAELEKLVNRGEYACAFSMFPTGIEDLLAIADAGGIMPPKSTWFEPKLRDAMFCHLI